MAKGLRLEDSRECECGWFKPGVPGHLRCGMEKGRRLRASSLARHVPTQDAKELDVSKFRTGPLSHSEIMFNGMGGWDAPYLTVC